jgi:hypothetical protein
MHRFLRKRLNHKVQHFPCTGKNTYGDAAFGPPANLQAYREGKIAQIKKVGGEEITSSLRLYFDGLLIINDGDEMSIDSGRRYPIIDYAHFDGLRPGQGTTVVYL